MALTAAGVPHTVHTFEHAPGSGRSYGEEAVVALDVDPSRVFKTLVTSVDDALWVAVVPVDAQLDLKSLAAAAGGKRASMADPAAAQRATGYVVGGISPFGQRRALPTVVDEEALSHPTVFVSGGRRGLDVEVAPTDLLRLTRALTAPLARR